MTSYRENRYNKRFKHRYNACPKCGDPKRKEAKACRKCYTKVSPFNKEAIIQSFGKLFK